MAKSELEELFLEVCGKYFEEQNGYEVRGELGLFSTAAVVWLGIQQRLNGNSLQSSLGALVDRIKISNEPFFLAPSNKKVREGKISLNTGGISRARDRLSEDLVRELYEEATKNIEAKLGIGKNAYILDGQIVTIARTKANLDGFGKTGNGEGELHFPRIRVVSAHRLNNGVAAGVAVGTWHDSEVGLARQIIGNIPNGALLIMDRGFHRPNFLEVAIGQGLKVLVRLKNSYGKKLIGTDPGSSGEKTVEWHSKRPDGSKLTLTGRVIKYTSEPNGFRSNEFYFFTNAEHITVQEVADYYRQRVQVEVFIRQLKQTLKLFFVRAKKAENVKKEILIAYLTFNLMRAIMQDTADATGCPVERLSFTATITLCNAYALQFTNAKTTTEYAKVFEHFRTNMLQTKLPLRKKPRSYPRVIKLPRDRYPSAGIVKNTQGEGK